MPETEEAITETTESVARMRTFDTATLPREKVLGTTFNFESAVPHANRLVALYKRLSLKALSDLPDGPLNTIKQRANADFSLFDQALSFDASQENAVDQRNTIIKNIEAAYAQSFGALSPRIAYGATVDVDFQRLESEARSAAQTIKDQGAALAGEMESLRDEASSTLAEVRKVAAEQGVTQQAEYFKGEADTHAKESEEAKSKPSGGRWGSASTRC